jgi:menaquinone-9 beta-reductase
MIYDAIIIGAGLAGCSTAIQLAERGHQVLLLEQQKYPTHKLCGEFLSVEVISIFERLGILNAVRSAGAVPIRHASVTTCSGQSFQSNLPGIALGLSRYQLDLILMRRAEAVGATCQDGTTVTTIAGDLQTGFTVTTSQDTFRAKMVIGAYGKRSGLDRSLTRPFMQRPSPFVACKAHYTGIELPSVVELHAFPGGYCGLSQIESGRVNVCWIGHKERMQAAAGTGDRNDVLSQNPVLAQRLKSMECVSSSSQALSQITFELKGKFDQDVWMIGDTAGMIAPLCGDGMAMALRSAELAVPMASAFLQGELKISILKHQYTSAWNREFRTRLQLGRLMHYGFIQPAIAHIGVQCCHKFPVLGNALIRATRGASYSEKWLSI